MRQRREQKKNRISNLDVFVNQVPGCGNSSACQRSIIRILDGRKTAFFQNTAEGNYKSSRPLDQEASGVPPRLRGGRQPPTMTHNRRDENTSRRPSVRPPGTAALALEVTERQRLGCGRRGGQEVNGIRWRGEEGVEIKSHIHSPSFSEVRNFPGENPETRLLFQRGQAC